MIPKSSKFPLRTDFLRFRARAARIATPHLTIYWGPARRNASALGVVVPKKLSKLATTRNWLKRLTYARLWPLIKDKNLDCVIVYRPVPLTRNPTSQATIISELLQYVRSLS